jgi:hypothetical protein
MTSLQLQCRVWRREIGDEKLGARGWRFSELQWMTKDIICNIFCRGKPIPSSVTSPVAEQALQGVPLRTHHVCHCRLYLSNVWTRLLTISSFIPRWVTSSSNCSASQHQERVRTFWLCAHLAAMMVRPSIVLSRLSSVRLEPHRRIRSSNPRLAFTMARHSRTSCDPLSNTMRGAF